VESLPERPDTAGRENLPERQDSKKDCQAKNLPQTLLAAWTAWPLDSARRQEAKRSRENKRSLRPKGADSEK